MTTLQVLKGQTNCIPKDSMFFNKMTLRYNRPASAGNVCEHKQCRARLVVPKYFGCLLWGIENFKIMCENAN